MLVGKLRKRNGQKITGLFVNPSKGGKKVKRKRLKKKKVVVRRRRSNPKRKTKKRKTTKRKTTRRRSPRTIIVRTNPSKRRRRRYRRRNPVARRMVRRKNPETLSKLKDVIYPGIAAFGGWAAGGLLWKLIGANNRKRVRGWFKNNPEGKGRALSALVAGLGLYFLSDRVGVLKKYQKSMMIGSALRLGYEGIGAFVSAEPGTTGESIRTVIGLPTASTAGSLYVGKDWPANVPPPAGTQRHPTTGKLVPASFEDGDYPYYDPFSQATYPDQAAYDAMMGGGMPAQGLPANYGGMPMDDAMMAGYGYNTPAVAGYAYNMPTVAGYGFNQVMPPESKPFPKPF